ncbi:MAG: hypothetical protein AB1578_08665 [Thermodesulfobacteriota bacterium]|jgi:hypothetical protein
MQYRVFRVPAGGCGDTEEAVNRFLRGVRVLRVDRQFVPDGQGAFWSLCVEYLESPKARAAEAGEGGDSMPSRERDGAARAGPMLRLVGGREKVVA